MVGGCDIRVERRNMAALSVFGDTGWTRPFRRDGTVRVGLGAVGLSRGNLRRGLVFGCKRYINRSGFYEYMRWLG